MTILSDVDIRRRLAQGDLKVGPLEDEALQIQPASIDVRLGTEFVVYQLSKVVCLDPRDPSSLVHATERVVAGAGGFVLHPGQFSLASTVEAVTVPPDLVARIEGRSSIGRMAVLVHATAGFIDPGFQGQVTLELANVGQLPVRLYPGMRIAQIVLHQLSSPAERPYGRARGSSYQDQRGPQPSGGGLVRSEPDGQA